jgi:hypothetical protein
MQVQRKAVDVWIRAARLLRIASRREVAVSSLRTSVVVGAALNIINQGHLMAAGLSPSILHTLLNFAVPFCVASYSAARQSIIDADSSND